MNKKFIENQLEDLLLTFQEFILELYWVIVFEEVYYLYAILVRGHQINHVPECFSFMVKEKIMKIDEEYEVLLTLRTRSRHKLSNHCNLLCIISSF